MSSQVQKVYEIDNGDRCAVCEELFKSSDQTRYVPSDAVHVHKECWK